MRTRKLHVFLFLAVTLAFLYLRTFFFFSTPLLAAGDEVLFFGHAIRILQGQVPFRDFFTFVIPGAALLYAGAFRLLGIHAWLAQAFVIGLGFAIACLVVWVSSRILSGPRALLPGLLFLVLDFYNALDATHHWYSTLIAMAAAATLMGGRSIRRIVAAGALCGIATIFTQTRGVLSLIAIALYLFLVRRKSHEARLSMQLLALILPFAVIVAGVLGYCAYQAGFNSLFYALGYFPVKFGHTLPAYTLSAYFLQIPPHGTLSDLARMVPIVFIYALVPFVYIFGLLRLFRQKQSMDRQLWEDILLISLVGIAFFAAVATGPTYHRLCMAAPPAIVIFVWLFSGTKRIDRGMRVLLWSLGTVLVLYLPLRLQLQWRAYLDLPIGHTAVIDPVEYEEVKWVAQHTHPGEWFFSEPHLSFALRLKNPTQLDLVTPNEFTRPEQVEAAVQALEDHQTHIIFLYPGLYASHQTGDNLAPFRQYLYKNYHLAQVYSSGQFWERN